MNLTCEALLSLCVLEAPADISQYNKKSVTVSKYSRHIRHSCNKI